MSVCLPKQRGHFFFFFKAVFPLVSADVCLALKYHPVLLKMRLKERELEKWLGQ